MTSIFFGHLAQFQRAGRIDDARVRGMKGRCTAALPAAMMHFLNGPPSWRRSCPGRAGGDFDFDVVGVEEAAVAAHDVDLARLGHAGEAAGELADDAVLVRAQLVDVDLGAAN
jgi:hypothetical protein